MGERDITFLETIYKRHNATIVADKQERVIGFLEKAANGRPLNQDEYDEVKSYCNARTDFVPFAFLFDWKWHIFRKSQYHMRPEFREEVLAAIAAPTPRSPQ